MFSLLLLILATTIPISIIVADECTNHYDCNNRTTCNECYFTYGCEWCEYTPEGMDFPSVQYCTPLDQCPDLFTTIDFTCPNTYGLSRGGLDFDDPGIVESERCGRFEMCGDCVSEYLCRWCSAGPGSCIDSSNPAEVLECTSLQGESKNTCDCSGWSSCNQCRTGGCGWCLNDEKDYCFDPIPAGAFDACVALPNGHVAPFCTTNHQISDQEVLPHNNTMNSSENKNHSRWAIIVVILAVISIFALLLGIFLCVLVSMNRADRDREKP